MRRAGVQTDDHSSRVRFDHNTAKRNYFVVFVALLQPLFLFFLTYSYSKQFVFSTLFAVAMPRKAVVNPVNEARRAGPTKIDDNPVPQQRAADVEQEELNHIEANHVD